MQRRTCFGSVFAGLGSAASEQPHRRKSGTALRGVQLR